MNFKDIFRTANSNLFRSKVRTLLTIISIFVGAFTITLTVGITSGISTYIDEQLGSIGGENILSVEPKVEVSFGSGPKRYDPERGAGTSVTQVLSMDAEDVKRIEAQDGIAKVQPSVTVVADYIQHADSDKYEVAITSYYTGVEFETEAGQLPDNSSPQPQILLLKSYLEPLGFKSAEDAVGKDVTVAVTSTATGQQSTVKANIVGVQSASLFSIGGSSGNDTLLSELSNIQFAGLPDEVRNQFPAVAAFMEEGLSQQEVEDLKADLDKLGFTARTIKDQIGVVKQIINAVTYILVFFGAIALVAASFGIINTLYMAVQERTKEIGLMKAMGMGRKKVFLLFSVEAALIGFWGSLLGVLAAVGVGKVANNIATDSFLKDLEGFDLTAFSIQSVLVIMLIVMVIAFLAGTLPARRAAKQDAIDALRYE